MPIGHHIKIIAAVAVFLFVGTPFASARQWKATPQAQARDYATITDTRTGEMTLLMWFVPEMIGPDTPGASVLTPILRKYVLLVAVHGKLDKPTGTFVFDDVTDLHPTDQDGKPLTAVPRDLLPPTTTGLLAAVEAMYRQSIGNMGTRMKMFVFEAGNVDSCKKGELSLPFANDTYTWQTPVPGCASF